MNQKKTVLFVLLLFCSFSVLHAQTTFSNRNLIQIPDGSSAPIPGNPYPAPIEVSGLQGSVSKLVVTLHGFTHVFPDAVDILLAAPDGTNAVILSDVGGGTDVEDITLTLDDAAAGSLPDYTVLSSGRYKPTNFGSSDTWPAPAPAASGFGSLAAFNGVNPNGTWKLYVVNDMDGSYGSVNEGWSLTLSTSLSTLPAGITHFDAVAVKDEPLSSVLLSWKTGKEVHGDGFVVETSVNGNNWKVLSTIKATHEGAKGYQYRDSRPAPGKNFYRIRSVDRSGEWSYSKVISVLMPVASTFRLIRQANAAQVLLYSEQEGPQVMVQVVDMSGRVLLQKQQALKSGAVPIINTRDLRSGVYLLRVSSGTQSLSQQLLING